MRIVFLLSSFLLVSCSGFDITDNEIVDAITQPDYVSSSRAKKLDIPPDLSEIESNSEYGIPGEAVSYKDYEDAKRAGYKEVKVLANPEGMRIVKSGNLRWLVVSETPEELWPHMESFWEELGFGIKVLNRRTGVMETEWIKSSKLNVDTNKGLGSRFDAWLDGLANLADRRKFRTRLENGLKEGTTEIYISQRSIVGMDQDAKDRIARLKEGSYSTELYKIQEYIPDDEAEAEEITEKLKTEMNLDEYEINAEILRRLMTKLGMTDFDAKQKLANPIEKKNATLVKSKKGNYLLLNDAYDRSWRRLSLALDIIGFVTEDKNRSDGIFYVKYRDLDLEGPKKKNKGLIDKLAFWEDDEEEAQRIKEEEERLNNLGVTEETEVIEDKSLTEKIKSLWGTDDEKGLSKNEKRYRIRIKEEKDGARVYMDYPNGKLNNTKTAKSILNIIYEHLR
jgi:outer membrane protein assembly factor BamC|tara:strand:- start:99 stop:1451 length:1353 start_codon:yes stop_codon:yes gene_type:complete